MAQLAERQISLSEDLPSNLASSSLFTVNCMEKTKINEKRPQMGHFKNDMSQFKIAAAEAAQEAVGKI